jgi:hypothetical protein
MPQKAILEAMKRSLALTLTRIPSDWVRNAVVVATGDEPRNHCINGVRGKGGEKREEGSTHELNWFVMTTILDCKTQLLSFYTQGEQRLEEQICMPDRTLSRSPAGGYPMVNGLLASLYSVVLLER